MLEYLNFFLLCTLFALIFYLYIRVKRYLTLLKMAEEIFSGYETPQSDSKKQKLLECILTRNSKLYLGKVSTKEKIKDLSDEEVDKLFNNYEAKLVVYSSEFTFKKFCVRIFPSKLTHARDPLLIPFKIRTQNFLRHSIGCFLLKRGTQQGDPKIRTFSNVCMRAKKISYTKFPLKKYIFLCINLGRGIFYFDMRYKTLHFTLK